MPAGGPNHARNSLAAPDDFEEDATVLELARVVGDRDDFEGTDGKELDQVLRHLIWGQHHLNCRADPGMKAPDRQRQDAVDPSDGESPAHDLARIERLAEGPQIGVEEGATSVRGKAGREL